MDLPRLFLSLVPLFAFVVAAAAAAPAPVLSLLFLLVPAPGAGPRAGAGTPTGPGTGAVLFFLLIPAINNFSETQNEKTGMLFKRICGHKRASYIIKVSYVIPSNADPGSGPRDPVPFRSLDPGWVKYQDPDPG